MKKRHWGRNKKSSLAYLTGEKDLKLDSTGKDLVRPINEPSNKGKFLSFEELEGERMKINTLKVMQRPKSRGSSNSSPTKQGMILVPTEYVGRKVKQILLIK